MGLSPLCIIQARYGSTRLPGKMLCDLGGETLIARGYRLACEAFHPANVVVAIPAKDGAGPLGDELRRIDATVFGYDGPEHDVLGRFYACAHSLRWTPDAVIVRYTPDDPFKRPDLMQRVAEGVRLPVELGGEAFTLAMLDEAYFRNDAEREHLTTVLFPVAPPPAPPGQVWTIDTQADLEAARQVVAGDTPAKRDHDAPAPARPRRSRTVTT